MMKWGDVFWVQGTIQARGQQSLKGLCIGGIEIGEVEGEFKMTMGEEGRRKEERRRRMDGKQLRCAEQLELVL